MDDLVLARALHVLGVVIWIGGVSMATTVALPAIRRGLLGPDPLAAFHAIESRFVWQARGAVALVGLTGLYLLQRLDLWARFADGGYWWMHAMVCVWSLFFVLLFIVEPLILHRLFPAWVRRDPETAFRVLHIAHIALLVLSLVTVFGALAGSHGWFLFGVLATSPVR